MSSNEWNFAWSKDDIERARQALKEVRGVLRAGAVDIPTAAKRLGITTSGLRRMLRERRGPAFFRAGRLIRIRVTDLEAWIDRNRVEPTKPEAKE